MIGSFKNLYLPMLKHTVMRRYKNLYPERKRLKLLLLK
jgi:hypothetical protein